jgi:hypothetical protein
MMGVNKKQIVTILIGSALFALCGIFPPKIYVNKSIPLPNALGALFEGSMISPQQVLTNPEFHTQKRSVKIAILKKVAPEEWASATPEEQQATLDATLQYWQEYFSHTDPWHIRTYNSFKAAWKSLGLTFILSSDRPKIDILRLLIEWVIITVLTAVISWLFRTQRAILSAA